MITSKLKQNKYIGHLGRASFLLPLLLIMLLGFSCSACSPIQEIRTRAYIVEKDPNWRIAHGNLHGQLETDLLTSDIMAIEVFVFRGDNEKRFSILTEFNDVKSGIVFRPQKTTVKFSAGEIAKAKGVKCSSEKGDSSSQESQLRVPTEEQIQITEKSCYYLVFDHQPPSIEEEFVMYWNDSLTLNDAKVNVPPVHFRKTISNLNRWGFFQ